MKITIYQVDAFTDRRLERKQRFAGREQLLGVRHCIVDAVLVGACGWFAGHDFEAERVDRLDELEWARGDAPGVTGPFHLRDQSLQRGSDSRRARGLGRGRCLRPLGLTRLFRLSRFFRHWRLRARPADYGPIRCSQSPQSM